MLRRFASVIALAVVASSTLAACASDPSDDEEEDGSSEGAQTVGGDGTLYFHGMSHLGFTRTALRATLTGTDFLAPSMSDGELQSTTPPRSVATFIENKDRVTAGGYSLGRAPVLSLMKNDAKHLVRTVLIDPTYDGSSALGRNVGGAITKQWLDGDDERTFLLVYGDVTKSLGGEQSFVRALADHPRAELCYVPGDHARFRADDMTAALVAKDCADLKARLASR